MRALFFDNQDYLLEVLRKEFLELRQKSLETKLEHAFGKDIGPVEKTVTLELEDNTAIDGIELRYIPKNAKSWREIKEIRVRVNERSYGLVKERNIFGTRYVGDSKIDIQIVDEHLKFPS